MMFLVITLWIFLCQALALTDTNCTGVECDTPSPSCPSDSTLHDGNCTCDTSLCKAPPICYDHQQLVLVKSSSKRPGDCCDVYECLTKPDVNCSTVQCPQQPDQCPGDSYQLPTSWHVGDCCGKALGCQCLPSCAPPSCGPDEEIRVVRVGTGTPGSCCPIYECIAKGLTESCVNGTTWSADCEDCQCERGIKFCKPVQCPGLPDPCIKAHRPPGQCCPVCLGEIKEESTSPQPPSDLPLGGEEYASCLLENGTLLHVGDTYFKDPCTNCTCLPGGLEQCTASMCEVPCLNPVQVQGECCPLCDGSVPLLVDQTHCPLLSNCRLKCKRGFVKTEHGCITCQCQDEECLLDCEHGYRKDTNGNDLCECAPPPTFTPTTCPPLEECDKKCPHGLKRKNGCEICRCANCPSMNQCEKQCAHGYARDDTGCHMCKCKPSDSTSNSACYTEDGSWRDDSEIWRDGCRECHCIDGREMCTLISCPVLTCDHPVRANATQCCAYCPDTPFSSSHPAAPAVCMDFHGELKREGQHWTLNPCTDCTCREGKVLCYSQQCPPAACSNPLPPEPGSCCPRCNDSDSGDIPELIISKENGVTDCGDRKTGSSWRESACVSCRCELGHKICYQQECPASETTCVRAVQPKHACCPTCLDSLLPKVAEKSSGCRVGNVTYQELQEWRIDSCTSCVCRDGAHQCTQHICSVSCAKPVSVPNKCCPVCLNNPLPPSDPGSQESATNRQIRESLYILLLVLFAVSTMFALYACRQMRARRNRLHLQEYGCPPPQYQYKYIPTYEGPQARPLSPSTDEKEKLALEPV
uniref:Cysteine-rich motor neuron 1 protein n=1 Tax=Cacopsylla melanoneura TaxID=428564 RepID=A0A8D8VYB3_9HEMI